MNNIYQIGRKGGESMYHKVCSAVRSCSFFLLLFVMLLILPVKVHAGGDYPTPDNVYVELYNATTLRVSWSMSSYYGVSKFVVSSYSMEQIGTGGSKEFSKTVTADNATTTVTIPLKDMCPVSGEYVFQVVAVGSDGESAGGEYDFIAPDLKPTVTPEFYSDPYFDEYNVSYHFGWEYKHTDVADTVNVYRDGKKIASKDNKTYGSYTDDTVVPGETYKYQLSYSNSYGEGPLNTPLTVKIPALDIKTPTGFNVVAGIGTAAISFHVPSNASSYGDTGFEIWKDGAVIRSAIRDGYINYNCPISETAASSFKARAFVTIKGKKMYSPFTVTKSVVSGKIGKVSSVVVTKISNKQVGIGWNTVDGAQSYNVYKGNKLIKSTKSNYYKYKGKGAGKGRYRVEAVRKVGSNLYKTQSASVKPKANQKTFSNSINYNSYTWRTCPFIIKKISLKGSTYTITGYACNNRIFTMKKYAKLSIAIKCNNKQVAKKTYRNLSMNVGGYSSKKKVLKIKGKPGQDLLNKNGGWSTTRKEVW